MVAQPITPHTSSQIEILRPLCIFFMLYVHVNPGFDKAIHSGVNLYFGIVIVDILGRTSVAALSLVSGFLLAYGMTRKDVGILIWGRIRALYLPMIFWSSVFIAMALSASFLFGYTSEVSRILQDLPMDRLILEKLMFLHGIPANPSLGFLRDLTASSILLILVLHITGRAVFVLWFALFAILGVALFGTIEPVIYRPTIPLFMLAGATLYQARGNLHIPPIYAISAVALYAALVIGDLSNTVTASIGQGTIVGERVENIAKRTTLTILALTISSALVKTSTGKWLRGMTGGVFLTFLCHTTVISVLWAVWKSRGGYESHWSYIIFFSLSPILVMVLATRVSPVLDCLPAPIQIVLRGKAVARTSCSKGARIL